MKRDTVLVAWISLNHDPYERAADGSYVIGDGARAPGLTMDLLSHTQSPIHGRVSDVYMLVRRAGRPEPGARAHHPREIDVFHELRQAIAEHDERIRVEAIEWRTDAAPTDHAALFRFVAQSLATIHRKHPQQRVAVNLSAGTGAMHTVTLLALQARLAGDEVVAYQGTPPKKRRGPRDVFQEVPWNLLREIALLPEENDGAGPTSWTLAGARSPRLRTVSAAVERFGGAPFPVLILGARGTGKTAVARRLRDLYSEWRMRAAPPAWEFHLNCAEFQGDPNILRSALFGHVKGAHSTATELKIGVLERAGGDCVFLDEIHRMDPQAQGLLLLALQRDGLFRRLGSDAPIRSQFRLLAASNLTRAALRERLAPDLFDRIADLVIELPDLRDCRDDLPEIWRSVLGHACDELAAADPSRASAPQGRRQRIVEIQTEFEPYNAQIVEALAQMRLPGNFRDLEKLARRLLVRGLARSRVLVLQPSAIEDELKRLREGEQGDFGAGRPDASLVEQLPSQESCEFFLRDTLRSGDSLDGPALLEVWEARLIEAAVAVAGSGIRAARLIGMNGRTFNARREKLGVAKARRSRPT